MIMAIGMMNGAFGNNPFWNGTNKADDILDNVDVEAEYVLVKLRRSLKSSQVRRNIVSYVEERYAPVNEKHVKVITPVPNDISKVMSEFFKDENKTLIRFKRWWEDKVPHMCVEYYLLKNPEKVARFKKLQNRLLEDS